MNIYEFLHNSKNLKIYNVPTGHSTTPEELYENCIPINFQKLIKNDPAIITSIIEWHKLLLRYIERPGAVLMSRLYEHEGEKGEWNTRRGCLTISNNYRYAFASNHFARIIYTMAINKFVPTDDEFFDMVVNLKFSLFYEHKLTPIEKRIAAYSNTTYEHLYYTPGWYLAHIISVNDCEYFGYKHISISNIFKLGEESDWKYDNNLERMVRRNDDTLSYDELKVAKAHFIRFLDPINHFLVPGKNNIVYNKINQDDRSPIGENKLVLNFITLEAYKCFGKHFIEFLDIALVDKNYINEINSRFVPNSKIDAWYSTAQFTKEERAQKTVILTKKNKSTKVKKTLQPNVSNNSNVKNSTITTDDKYKAAAYYLLNKISLEKVEENILNLFGKRGWVAKDILNSLGIDTSKNSVHSGCLIKNNIDDLILNASDDFKNTLEEIKKRNLHI